MYFPVSKSVKELLGVPELWKLVRQKIVLLWVLVWSIVLGHSTQNVCALLSSAVPYSVLCHSYSSVLYSRGQQGTGNSE